MKKVLICSIVILFIIPFCYPQEEDSIEIYRKHSTDELIFEITRDNWITPTSGVEIKPVSLGVCLSLIKEFANEESWINLALGLGISSQNIKSNSTVFIDSTGNSYFSEIPDNTDYKKNKLSTVFIEVPFELRIKTNPDRNSNRFKIAAGFKAGYNLQRYTKYEGDDFRNLYAGDKIKIKQYRIKNILMYRYGVYARIGYGKFCITGFYSLTPLFEENKGPEIIPYYIGLAIIPFK